MCMVAHCVAQKAEIEVSSFLRESLGLLCGCYFPSEERVARCNVYSLEKKKLMMLPSNIGASYSQIVLTCS